VQYICVIIAEFNLARHVIRVFKKRKATAIEIEEQFMRFKKIGSSLSTVRMAMRLGMLLSSVEFFLGQFMKF
jgi:hypothetical protein